MSYSSRNTVVGGNGPGNSSNQLNGPIGLLFDFISNWKSHLVVRWNLADSHWTLLAGSPGLYGRTPSLLREPAGLALDPMGNLYVADSVNSRVQLFKEGYTDGETIAGIPGVFAPNATTLSRPIWVQLDDQLNLYVSDFNNNRIQKFFRYWLHEWSLDSVRKETVVSISFNH